MPRPPPWSPTAAASTAGSPSPVATAEARKGEAALRIRGAFPYRVAYSRAEASQEKSSAMAFFTRAFQSAGCRWAVIGGVAYGVPEGSTYGGSTFPTASNEAAGALSNYGKYDGNLMLLGSPSDPIVLDGEIAVDGDLLIRGTVKGTGQIFVKGNTYIAGSDPRKDGQAVAF